VVCGKHTMVRLQISLQVSKQPCQSDSKNIATVYHRLLNKTTKGMTPSHGAIQTLQRMPPESQKKVTQDINRALGHLCGYVSRIYMYKTSGLPHGLLQLAQTTSQREHLKISDNADGVDA
jgi:hypothetical protein